MNKEQLEQQKKMEQFKAEAEQLSSETKVCLDRFQTAFAAFGDVVTPTDMKNAMDNMYSSMSYLHQRINNVHDRINNHMQNHLPPTPSQAHLGKAIKALGWDDSYEVPKKQIGSSYASRDFIVD